MGTIKIIIAEKDGVEFEYNTEMDLIQALTHVGFTASPFDPDNILTDYERNVLVDNEGNVLAEGY